jgi:aminoglycoside phosphotransferase (APT) family kinase protein
MTLGEVATVDDSTPGIDWRRLAAWMDANCIGDGPISEIAKLDGGTQNIIVRFRRRGDVFVLRRPPIHKRANSDETMEREARILAALAGTDVPHPAMIASCQDSAVLGASFYLMSAVDGVNPTVELPPPYRTDSRWRTELGLAVVDGAVAIASVDHVAVGLGGLGNADGFLGRQVERWQRQLDSYRELPGYPGAQIPGLDRVAAWLETNRPPDGRPGLMHGDYHLANILCDPRAPRVAAIVDWELSTIGDPLLDLGWLLAGWPGDDGAPLPLFHLEPWDGFPSASQLVEHYATQSGRDLSAIAWYEVLACFKLGIILEGSHARACAGRMPESIGDRMHAATLALFERAAHRIMSAG